MQNTKMDFVKVKKLAKVILTSSLKLTGVCAIYFINLARAILNRTSKYFTSFISNQFTLSISLRNKNSEVILNKRASISSISKYLMIFGLIFVLVAAMFSVAINAADPGHGASVIGSGVFESGTYTFPLNLIVNSNLSIGVRSLFVNSNLTRVGIGTNEPSNTLDVRGIINSSGEIYVNNQTALSTFSYNESSSYQQFWYNQSDNSQLLFNYNQTWNNESSKYLQINSSTATLLTNESGSYTPITWAYNQSDNSQLLFNYNQSAGSFNQYGIYWYNQSDNSLLLFNYNQSSASETQFGKFWYNMSDGSGVSPWQFGTDTIYNDTTNIKVGIGTSTPSRTLDVRGIGNFSGDLYVANQTLANTWLFNQTANYLQINSSTAALLTNESIKYLQINSSTKAGLELVTNESSKYLQLNVSTYAGITNESGSYAPIKWAYNQSDNSQLLFNYNQTWNNESSKYLQINSSTRNGLNNESASYAGVRWNYNQTTPILSMSNIWLVPQNFTPSAATSVWTYNSNVTMNANITFNSKNNGVTFNAASRIYDNGSCLIIRGRTSVIEVC